MYGWSRIDGKLGDDGHIVVEVHPTRPEGKCGKRFGAVGNVLEDWRRGVHLNGVPVEG